MSLSFFEKKAEEIEEMFVGYYESMVGPCAVGSPQRGFIKVIVYMMFVFGKYFDSKQKMNLLRYSTGEYLDALGEFRGSNAIRLADKQSFTTFEIEVEDTGKVQTIQAGFKVAAIDGLIFETTEDVEFEPGEILKTTPGQCMTSGEVGNGYMPGQINKPVDVLGFLNRIENTSISQGGANIEGDDKYRERLKELPESFSVAGPSGAYKSIAMGVSPEIIDVYVGSPLPAVVDIRPLLTGGELPDTGILEAVLEACDDKTVRPLTDKVIANEPKTTNYDLEVRYWVSSIYSNDIEGTKLNIELAINNWILWTRSKLGRDINPDVLVSDARDAGAKRIEVVNPTFQPVIDNTIAIVDKINISYEGVEDEKGSGYTSS